MRKKLISAGICGALARFCAYTLYSILLSVLPHSFAITGPLTELWSNVFSYVIEIGCWLASALIMLIFAFSVSKDKKERKIFVVAAFIGVLFGGAINTAVYCIGSMLIMAAGRPELYYIAHRITAIAECAASCVAAVYIFKKASHFYMNDLPDKQSIEV